MLDQIQNDRMFGYLFIWQLFNMNYQDVNQLLLLAIFGFPVKMKATEITDHMINNFKQLQKDEKLQQLIDKVDNAN